MSEHPRRPHASIAATLGTAALAASRQAGRIRADDVVGRLRRRWATRWRQRLAETAILHLPSGSVGNRAKYAMLVMSGAEVTWPVHIDPDVWIRRPGNLRAGPGLVIARGAVLNCAAPVTLGRSCLVGYHSYIGTAMHNIPDDAHQAVADAGHTFRPVTIADGVWIAAHACVLPGVTLGEGAVVAAGAVVTTAVGAGEVVAGVPAEVVRRRSL